MPRAQPYYVRIVEQSLITHGQFVRLWNRAPKAILFVHLCLFLTYNLQLEGYLVMTLFPNV